MYNYGEMLIYQTEDGLTKIDVNIVDETVWLTQEQMAELFQRDKSTISRHIRNIFTEGELDEKVVVAEFATTSQHGAMDGKTQSNITRDVYKRQALDLALFFLQMRCGIRSIKEVNYNLMIVVIAYILLNEDFKRKSITYDYLEAWYWSSIFSGYFNIDQTERAITSIKKLIEAIKFEDSSWIKNISMGVFATNYFSEKQFLLLKKDDTGIVPKDFLKDAICQFFLARTYNGIIDNRILLTPFCKLALERHHVIPLGSLKYPNEKIKKSEDNLRNEKSYFLNSPVNFIYITDEENKSISDDKLSDYQMRVNNPSTRMLLGFAGNLDTSTEECCKSVLENRFDHINGQVRQQIDTLIP